MTSSCDICGRGEGTFVISLEGARMTVCRNCSSHGKVLYVLRDEVSAPQKPAYATPLQEEEIIEEYGKHVRFGREKLGLPIEVVAERISEKASYLESVERGQMKLTLATARKLEKELGVKLIEKVSDIGGPKTNEKIGSSREVTLSDFIVQKKK